MKAIKLLSLLLVMSMLTSCGLIVVNDGKGGTVSDTTAAGMATTGPKIMAPRAVASMAV